jgi:putative transcriptional regulator
VGVIRYRLDVLEALKTAGWSTYRLGSKGEKVIGERTIQVLREGRPVSFEILARLCLLLHCQPGDILEYVPDEDERQPGHHQGAADA